MITSRVEITSKHTLVSSDDFRLILSKAFTELGCDPQEDVGLRKVLLTQKLGCLALVGHCLIHGDQPFPDTPEEAARRIAEKIRAHVLEEFFEGL